MASFRVAKTEQQVHAAPVVEAEDAPSAAAQYVEENNLVGGRYFAQQEEAAVAVDVTVDKTVSAELAGAEEE